MQQQQQQNTQLAQPQFTFEGGHLVMYHKEQTGLTAKDATVNDQDRMTDSLNTAKHLTDEYNIAMNEASHDALYQVLKQNSDSVHQLERQLYSVMFKKGWYKLPVADAQSVVAAHTKFQQYKSQYPFPQKAQGATQTQGQSQVQTQIQAQTQMQTPSGQQTRTAQVSVKASPTSTQANTQSNTNMQSAGGQSMQASSNQSVKTQASGGQATSAQTAGAQPTSAQAGGAQPTSAQAGGTTNANQAVQQAVSQAIKGAEQGRATQH
jgi:spore coat protein CotF